MHFRSLLLNITPMLEYNAIGSHYKPSLLCFLFFCICLLSLNAQHIELMHAGSKSDDSSYYDICRTQDGQFFVGGKFGVLKCIQKDGTLTDVDFPRGNQSILRIQEFYNGALILAADAGHIYRKTNHQWSVLQIPQYKKSCFYDITIMDSTTAIVCGGKSEIAVGNRVIPFGFALLTTDGGDTWKPVYQKWNRMVWRVLHDKKNNITYMLTYSPFGSRVLESSNQGTSWAKSSMRGNVLWHDMELNAEQQFVFCGGKSGNLKRKEGIIEYHNKHTDLKQQHLSPNAGMIWDYRANDSFEVATGSKGMLHFKENSPQQTWKTIQVQPPVNLYEISFIDGNSAFIVGSNKTLYKLIMKDRPVDGL